MNRRFERSDLYFRYKREQKPENYSVDGQLYEIKELVKEYYRLNAIYHAGENIRFQNRIEVSRVFFREGSEYLGILGLQDIIYRHRLIPMEYSVRLAYFNVSDYKARIYAYEKDILYANSTQMHYGKGWRFMAMIKIEIFRYMTLWCKVAQFYYPGEKEIGSGLNSINGNHRTEIKLQAIAKF